MSSRKRSLFVLLSSALLAGSQSYALPDPTILLTPTFDQGPVGQQFLFAATLDDPDALPPDIHIYTESKQPWVALSGTVPVVGEYYRAEEVWPEESLARRDALRGLPGRARS